MTESEEILDYFNILFYFITNIQTSFYRPHTLYIHQYYYFLYLHYSHLTTCFGALHVRHHKEHKDYFITFVVI